MLRLLASGQRTVGELVDPFEMSFEGASKHIRVLEAAGLVRREVQGRTHVCRLAPKPLGQAHDWLSFYEQYWNDRFHALEEFLEKEAAEERDSARRLATRSTGKRTARTHHNDAKADRSRKARKRKS